MTRTSLILLALLAACGGSEDGAGSAQPPAAGAGGAAGSQAGSGGKAGKGGSGLSGASGQGGSGGSAGAAGGGAAGGGAAGGGAAGQGGSAGGGAAGAAGGGAAGASGQAGAAGAVVRTVETRSPFGALSAETNLVLDGDFEFSPASSIVPAWLAVEGQSNLVPIEYETGGRCDTGVYCARVPAGVTLANFAVSLPPGAQVKASIRIRPDKGGCDGAADPFLYTRVSTLDTGTNLTPESSTPDAGGWCTFSAVMKVSKSVNHAALYVMTSKTDVVVDRATVTATTKGSTLAPPALSPRAADRARQLEPLRTRRPGRKPAAGPPPIRQPG